MRVEKCSFCSSPCYPGHGSVFVRNDAKVFRFCRSKCKKNFAMKRNPRKVKWTKSFRRIHGKELTMDTCLELEQKTAVPVAYSRDLFVKAVDAIRRVGDIEVRRELVQRRNTLRGEKEHETAVLKKKNERNISFADEKEKKPRVQIEEDLLLE
ncbi:MAG: ribosome biogenesis protein RLP24 [Amphiamblys sp. WSBS2006]|nr:MAG: ribosome biogenesis protein RLP24 [Amphiamblys sp. WSBS2006]